MSRRDGVLDVLLTRAQQGDREAIDRLLGGQRTRLRRMIAVHLDARCPGSMPRTSSRRR